MKIRNLNVYGIRETLAYARFPMLPLDKPELAFQEEPDGKTEGRAKRLANTPIGSGHDNFLKGITVTFDVDFTNKAWVQAERYHWFEIISSMSTVHALTKTQLDESMFSEWTDKIIINRLIEIQQTYHHNPTNDSLLRLLYSCPAGITVRAGITTNYRQLKTIYEQRHNHVLPEWREFCKALLTLPYFKEWCTKGE